MNRSFVQQKAWMAAVGLVFIGAPAAITAGEPECTIVPGRVDFVGLEVVPPAPVVGDRVELHFDVDFAVYYVSSVRLLGASPLLTGETVSLSSDTTFILDAVEPGVASLRLDVAYGTEEYCPSIGAWFVGPILTKASQTFEISVGTTGNPSFTPAPATPTATHTNTPVVSCTPPPCPTGTLVCPDVCPGGCGTVCQPTGNLPDLIPSSAGLLVPPDGCVTSIPPPQTFFCVTNQGTAPAGAFDVALETAQPQRIDGLAAGEVECLIGPFFGSTVSVHADPSNEVAESDETNNVQMISFVVPTATPPPLCTMTATASPTPTSGTAGPTPLACPGDCNGDGSVSVDELLTGVNISLGNQPAENCPAMDANGDGRVAVNELVLAVRRNLDGCAAG